MLRSVPLNHRSSPAFCALKCMVIMLDLRSNEHTTSRAASAPDLAGGRNHSNSSNNENCIGDLKQFTRGRNDFRA